ncbi:MazG family protein [Curtobacterium sp. 1P10AnD]|uniref:MazG family protein n=1 Tax=Curtobacterium sp. 1P10AnD TaxID=3132283 RepID=UPI0039A1BBF7
MSALTDLEAVVDRLLAPEGGCVWNREQTHASLARYAVEEVYELVDAIDDGDEDELREELGDVLYQVVLHAGLAETFDLEDVAAGVRDKMVRRHPHVFGDEHADTVAEVERVWRAAKAAEKASRKSALDGVPRAMPPLERVVKLLERLEERVDAGALVASLGAHVDDEGGVGASWSEDDVVSVPTGTIAGAGRVDRGWGIDALRAVAGARADGIDPIASLRAAVTALEAEGRAAGA